MLDGGDETPEELLEQICHEEPGGCELFPTKPENTPPDLVQAVNEGQHLRELHQNGYVLRVDDYNYFQVTSHLAIARGENLEQAEHMAKPPEDEDKP